MGQPSDAVTGVPFFLFHRRKKRLTPDRHAVEHFPSFSFSKEREKERGSAASVVFEHLTPPPRDLSHHFSFKRMVERILLVTKKSARERIL